MKVSDGNDLIVSLTTGWENAICNVNNRVLVVGDLKFYAQVLGHENRSSFWCIWCNVHPNTWQELNNKSDVVPWTIEWVKEHKNRIDTENLKDFQGNFWGCRLPYVGFHPATPLHFSTVAY